MWKTLSTLSHGEGASNLPANYSDFLARFQEDRMAHEVRLERLLTENNEKLLRTVAHVLERQSKSGDNSPKACGGGGGRVSNFSKSTGHDGLQTTTTLSNGIKAPQLPNCVESVGSPEMQPQCDPGPVNAKSVAEGETPCTSASVVKHDANALRKTAMAKAEKKKSTKTAQEEGMSPCRQRVRWLVGTNGFEGISGLAVFLNAVLIGTQANFAVVSKGETPPLSFAIFDFTFVVIFLLELMLRIYGAGRSFMSRRNKELSWNVFDTLLVSIGVIETALALMEDLLDSSLARLFRLLRLIRILRIIRVFRFFKDLRVMVISIMSSVKPLAWALIILFGTIYVFAVAFLQFISMGIGGPVPPERFGSLGSSVYTLFGSMTGGVDWFDACDGLLEYHMGLGVCFIFYLSFTMFCMLNIITGIFVENARNFSALDEDLMLIAETEQRQRWIAEVRRLFDQVDADGSGSIEFEEFDEAMQEMEIQVLFKNLGIDTLSASTKFLFDLLDVNCKQLLNLDDLSDGLGKICGQAKSIEIAAISHRVQYILKQVNKMQGSIDLLRLGNAGLVDGHGYDMAAMSFPFGPEFSVPPVPPSENLCNLPVADDLDEV